jgi:hypothetical protein
MPRRRTHSAVFIDAARLSDEQSKQLFEDYDDLQETVANGRTVSRLNQIYSVNTVVNACMFLEANIHEFYRKALDDESTIEYNEEHNSPFTSTFYLNLREADSDYDTDQADMFYGNICRKYMAFLEYFEADQFDENQEPWDSCDLLVKLRNHFVHFESEYVDASPDPESHELAARLVEKGVPPNPWLEDANLVYVHRAFGPGLTSWAVRSAEEFVESFHQKVGADKRYQSLRPLRFRIRRPDLSNS